MLLHFLPLLLTSLTLLHAKRCSSTNSSSTKLNKEKTAVKQWTVMFINEPRKWDERPNGVIRASCEIHADMIFQTQKCSTPIFTVTKENKKVSFLVYNQRFGVRVEVGGIYNNLTLLTYYRVKDAPYFARFDFDWYKIKILINEAYLLEAKVPVDLQGNHCDNFRTIFPLMSFSRETLKRLKVNGEVIDVPKSRTPTVDQILDYYYTRYGNFSHSTGGLSDRLRECSSVKHLCKQKELKKLLREGCPVTCGYSP